MLGAQIFTVSSFWQAHLSSAFQLPDVVNVVKGKTLVAARTPTDATHTAIPTHL